MSVASPIVLPAAVVAALDGLPTLDFAALVAALRARFPVEFVEAPPAAARVRSLDDVRALEALTQPRRLGDSLAGQTSADSAGLGGQTAPTGVDLAQVRRSTRATAPTRRPTRHKERRLGGLPGTSCAGSAVDWVSATVGRHDPRSPASRRGAPPPVPLPPRLPAHAVLAVAGREDLPFALLHGVPLYLHALRSLVAASPEGVSVVVADEHWDRVRGEVHDAGLAAFVLDGGHLVGRGRSEAAREPVGA